MEEIHDYELVERIGRIVHLHCPTCDKEVVLISQPRDDSEKGYRVMRDREGNLLQGDFNARHRWGTGGMAGATITVQQGPQ